MPTDDELTQLRNTKNFTWSWDYTNKGYTVTSKVPGYVGNQIFLPAAGYRSTSLHNDGSNGYYWSSSLNTSSLNNAWTVYFGLSDGSSYVYGVSNDRYRGHSVRPVSE